MYVLHTRVQIHHFNRCLSSGRGTWITQIGGSILQTRIYIYIELFCDYITKHMLYSPSKIYSVYQLTKALGARRAGLKAFITLTSIAPNSVNTTPVFTDSWFGPAFIFIFRETNNMSHE